MRAFILVACLAVATVARPEAGYTYNGIQQQNQHGLPQNGLFANPQNYQQLPNEQNFASFGMPQMTYGGPEVGGLNPADQFSGIPVAPEEPLGMQPLAPQQDSYNMAYQQSSLPHESGYPYAPEQTKVHKHIYVHVPPKDFEDEDAIQPRVIHQGGPKQKHYKIVFIKAPSAPAIRAPIVAPAPQNEEKTLIYVLHKKPEAGQDIVIPTAAPTKPSKPEVFFIKYKTKKEEAPVYGPPPAVDMDPRFAEPTAEYGAPLANDMPAMDMGDLSIPPTTIQPVAEEQPIIGDLPNAQAYDAATMTAPIDDVPEHTMDSLTNQHMLPESTQAPIVVEEPHVPATNYGPPNRFFLKKKK